MAHCRTRGRVGVAASSVVCGGVGDDKWRTLYRRTRILFHTDSLRNFGKCLGYVGVVPVAGFVHIRFVKLSGAGG